jgi:hypothetical protein
MTRTVFILTLGVFFLTSSVDSFSQIPALRDTSRRTGGSPNGLRPYKEIITDKAKTDDGLFKVHRIDEKYFFEIPDSLFQRELLVVNRISKSASGFRFPGFFGYNGDEIGKNVIRFEKGPNNRIFLRNISFAEYTRDSTSPMFMAVNNSNIQPIAASFEIKSTGKDSIGAVIDVTDYINGDNDILHFSGSLKSQVRLASLQSDKSYVVGVKSYPINIEIKTVKTYGRSQMGSVVGAPPSTASGNVTLELNSSIVLLPRQPMQPRYADPRIGYFYIGYTDFDLNPQGIKPVNLVQRWRLEPKDGDMEKYLRGELVEPKKPIIFYIDPATPKKWVSYLIQGVNDWQPAFERAGFKNAIMAKLAPTWEEDSTWSLDDARYSAIVYKPSDVANASGPRISDPRSGEIMESHINWYHNVMELVHNWYFVQTAAVDPDARKMIFDDKLMGELIRFVSAHEVGHTIGLMHNYGASSSVPVEKLRDKAWLEANGHTPSIMDYARFNYVAQPEDNVGRAGLIGRVGDYDKWAIEWGYRIYPQFKSADAEKSHLNNLVIQKLKDKRFWFGTELNLDDPRSQSEQVGDDAIKATIYGIKNLQRIVPNLMEWTREANEDYSNLKEIYDEVTAQYSRYMGHVAKYVGGIMETPKMVEEQGAVYEIVPAAKQKEAVDFLNRQLFATPSWLINQEVYSRIGTNGLTQIGRIQDNVLGRLLGTRTLTKLVEAESALGNEAYQITELLADLKKGIWSELGGKQARPIDIYRRNLQKSYVLILANLVNPPPNTGLVFTLGGSPGTGSTAIDKSDIKSVVRAHLAGLRNEVAAAATASSDLMTRYHLQDVAKRIDNALNPK